CRIVANDGAPAQLRASLRQNLMVHTPVGCDSCGMTGYRGRLAVTEIVIADASLDRAIAEGAAGDTLTSIARRTGARSLWESAITHLAAGVTSGDELLRVLEQQPTEAAVNAGQLLDDSHAIVGAEYDSDHEPTGEQLTELIAGVVDVYVVRPLADGWKVLTLQRSNDTRCPTAWETVHGRLNADEKPEDGAVREVLEETGLDVSRLYNVTVQPFYLHMFGAVQFAIVFAAFVDEPAAVTLGDEHQSFEWLSPDDAAIRFAWPREREALSHIRQLLRTGNAGPVEDVLRVR
ncbi:MAG: NUDIX domain-containing protein, partial [Gemmatimonadaceae bacterium]